MNDDINNWIGKTIRFEDKVNEYPVKAMAAVFDYEYDKKIYKCSLWLALVIFFKFAFTKKSWCRWT